MSQEYTLEDVQAHTSKTSCWIILHNDVYDVTQWLQDHPGGNEILLEAAGQDCTLQFEENKHSDDARGFASKYKIGHLAGSPQIAMPRAGQYVLPKRAASGAGGTDDSATMIVIGAVAAALIGGYFYMQQKKK